MKFENIGYEWRVSGEEDEMNSFLSFMDASAARQASASPFRRVSDLGRSDVVVDDGVAKVVIAPLPNLPPAEIPAPAPDPTTDIVSKV